MDKDGYHGYYRDERPPQRPWVGLTDDEIQNALPGYRLIDAIDIYRSIEAKLKDKNVQR
jgi:hypothetical protein